MLSLLRWLPPPKLSKVGLFRGSHGRRPTTTGLLGPFLLHLCQWVIVEAISTKQDVNQAYDVDDVNQAREQVNLGPITRSRAKKLQQEVNALLCVIHFNINNNYILPKSCTLLLLGFTKEDNMNTKKTTEKHNTQTRPVLQNSMKEAIITFNPQKL